MRVWLYRKDAAFRELFRPNVEVRFLEDGGTFSNDKDVLFVHEGDACPEGISQACCRKIEFEQKKLHQCLLQPLAKNYDAGWLKYQLRRTDPFDTVVAGSSYPMFGLDMQQLPSWRNLSLASQDFYYAILLLKKLYEHQPYRRVVLGHYYYTIFSDLSRTENPGEIVRVANVYTDVLGGGTELSSPAVHHASLLAPPPQGFYRSLIYDMPRLHEQAVDQFFDAHGKDYWNSAWKRVALRGCLWSDRKKAWKDITPEERDRAGRLRVQPHNKALKYVSTYWENVCLLQSFGVWCQERGIQLVFLIFPVSQSYDRYLDPQFKKTYYEMLKGFSFPFEFLDLMVQTDGVTDEDFNDTDHLNDLGAQRLTMALKAVLPERVADK